MVARSAAPCTGRIHPTENSMNLHQSLVAAVASFFVLTLGAAAGGVSPAGNDSAQTLAPEVIRADFAALYAGLQSAHANVYAQRSQADYDARYEQMLATFDQPMSRFDVTMAFQRFAAYGNVGHARIEFPNQAFEDFRANGGKVLSLYPRVVDGVVYVGNNLTGDDRIKDGDQWVAIDGQPMAHWLQRAAEHISADSEYLARSLMEFTFPRDLWAVVGERDRFEVTLRRDAELFTLSVGATTRDAKGATSAQQSDVFMLDSNARESRMLNDAIAYLKPGPFYNVDSPSRPWDNAAFVSFIDKAFTQFIDGDAKWLIVDLRQNPGGANSFSAPMLAWIADRPFRFFSEFLIRSSDEAAASNAARLTAQDDPNSVSAQFAKRYDEVPRGQMFKFDLPFAQPRDAARFEGQVVALVNRHSFSNAVNVAAIVQDYGFGIIAGEATADLATTYGSMEQFELPQTGIRVGFPKSHIIRPSGDRTPGGVTPDWTITSPVGPQKDDVVLNALVERIVREPRRR